MRIIEDVNLLQDGIPYEVKRSWYERWMTRPWRPWVSKKIVIPKVPYRGAMLIGRNTFIMHPRVAREYRCIEHREAGLF